MPHHFKIQNRTNYKQLGLTPLLQGVFIKNCKVDFIGRIENFDKDINHVINKLNDLCSKHSLAYKFNFQPIKINTSIRSIDTESYYDHESKEALYSLLEPDFIQLNYPK
jgi:hypothetical protein